MEYEVPSYFQWLEQKGDKTFIFTFFCVSLEIFFYWNAKKQLQFPEPKLDTRCFDLLNSTV